MSQNNSEVINELKQASSGLLFMSESDYPFDVIEWKLPEQKNLTNEELLKLIHQQPDTPIEVVDLDSFFSLATTEQDWYEEPEKEAVKKYQSLVSILKQNLSDVKVYRVGKRNINIYIVGKTSSNDLVGLSTQVVET